ncbi:Cytosol aminopeptidase [Mizuhopecten yessoensis]|uniref:Cytosol aminopeptidase n=1 Tax=Mizuhopecten yessoensis TaxID=6573 RepID=A0A210PY99_MIZYE|nr:Cytosol aminopeptidase [Mizuhopecten yessoensis]
MAASLRHTRGSKRGLLQLWRGLRDCNAACFSTSASRNKGLVLGLFESEEENGPQSFTKATQKFDDRTKQKVTHHLQLLKKNIKKGQVRIFYDLDPEYSSVAVTCVGKRSAAYDEVEGMDMGRDQIRAAVAKGVQELQGIGETEVAVDPCGDAEAAAEGGHLALFVYQELKAEKSRKAQVNLDCFTDSSSNGDNVLTKWSRGRVLAEAQNFARHLMEMPSNKLTPGHFVDLVSARLTNTKRCSVTVRDRKWIESQKMGSFLSVAEGSVKEPFLLEVDYKGDNPSNQNPLALVGKGITFDTGGISLKPPADMDKMRADMGGAACVAGTLLALGNLNVPVHVKAFIPLCENMADGRSTKPGDVVTAMNGKTIQVDNTDAEGRLILADALCYAETFNPELILDMATLTGAIDVALGAGATGVYTNSLKMWEHLHKAGTLTGDRVWRMPLFNHYTKQVTMSDLADINNIGTGGRSGGSCTAAAFLREFVTNKQWMHLDIAGVMMNKSEIPYLNKGMAGNNTSSYLNQIEL